MRKAANKLIQMTGSSLLLDTNVIIDLFKKKPQVTAVVAKTENVFVPLTVLGELYVGAFLSSRQEVRIVEIENFISTCFLLEIDKGTTKIYGRVKAAVWKRGQPISENDIWIAATTIQYDLPIYTFDKHFKNVDGLQLFNPLSSI